MTETLKTGVLDSPEAHLALLEQIAAKPNPVVRMNIDVGPVSVNVHGTLSLWVNGPEYSIAVKPGEEDEPHTISWIRFDPAAVMFISLDEETGINTIYLR